MNLFDSFTQNPEVSLLIEIITDAVYTITKYNPIKKDGVIQKEWVISYSFLTGKFLCPVRITPFGEKEPVFFAANEEYISPYGSSIPLLIEEIFDIDTNVWIERINKLVREKLNILSNTNSVLNLDPFKRKRRKVNVREFDNEKGALDKGALFN